MSSAGELQAIYHCCYGDATWKVWMSLTDYGREAFGKRYVESRFNPNNLLAEVAALRQQWATPDDLFGVLDDEFEFDLDAAALKHNAKCGDFISPELDSLKTGWIGGSGWVGGCISIFCNPGFSDMMPWIKKAAQESRDNKHIQHTIVMIGLASTGSEWYTLAEQTCHEIRLLTPRPQFIAPKELKASSNAKDNAVYIWRGGHRPAGHANTYQWKWKQQEETK